MIPFRKKKKRFIVAIEYTGSLEGPAAHLATNPERFVILSHSPRAARARARWEWVEKYDASPRMITAATVESQD